MALVFNRWFVVPDNYVNLKCMKRICLTSPAYRNKPLENVRVLALPPLNLMLIAACTPPEYDVSSVDEAFDGIDYD
ncbi:hypothetical protein BVX99_00615 [bacterium F16]|nr:hypothetical protein BVX99_00615 [bacterium F16]